MLHGWGWGWGGVVWGWGWGGGEGRFALWLGGQQVNGDLSTVHPFNHPSSAHIPNNKMPALQVAALPVHDCGGAGQRFQLAGVQQQVVRAGLLQ